MLDAALDAAHRWLIFSDIREKDPQKAGYGGLRQAYNTVDHDYSFVYSEISGYAISALVNFWSMSGDEQYLSLAENAAQFVQKLQIQTGDFLFQGAVAHGLTLPGYTLRPAYYSFDNAMILQGLLDLHAGRPSPALLASACAIGDWLVNVMQREDGSFLAVRVADPTFMLPGIASAFGDGGCLHAKHAIGLLKLHHTTGDERYALAARKVCDWVLTLQDTDGAIQSTIKREKVVTHTHCYAVEGLLYAAYALQEPRYQAAALRAAHWLLSAQNRGGSLSIDYKQQWWRMGRRIIELALPKKVSDATAQALRIWSILEQSEGDVRFCTASQQAAGFLLSLQKRSTADPNADGGFVYWPGHPMQFAWSTMFAIQALQWLKQPPTLEQMHDQLF